MKAGQEKLWHILEFLSNLCVFSINSNEFVTCGRLLLKSTSNNQNKRKDSTTSQSKSKIRYRLSSKYDFKNLKFGTEGSCQNNDEEELRIIETENDTNERIVELIDTQENLKEFEEVKTVQHSVHNDTELDKTVSKQNVLNSKY